MGAGLIEYMKKKIILKRFTFGYGGAISAGAAKRLLPSDAGYSIPEGYHPIGISHFSTGSGNLVLDYINPQNNSGQSSNYFIAVKNVHASSSVGSTVKATIDILFAPEWMIKFIDSDEPAKLNGDIFNEPVFLIKNFSCAYSSLAKDTGAKAFTRSNFNFFVPEGYEIFSLRNFGSGAYRVSVSDCDPFSNKRLLTIRNTYTAAASGTAELGVVFINRKFMIPDKRKGLIIRYNYPSGYNYDTYGRWLNFQPQPKSFIVYDNEPIKPADIYGLINTEFTFSFTSNDDYTRFYPQKVEVISGAEYIQFVDSLCYKFIIPEDWTNRQIILNYTFE